MKTIEQKAKAYDEALERAKQLYVDGMPQISRNTTEYIFPELKESEDERIRGAIIDHLKDNNLTEWAAWLENQGEQKQLYIRFGEIPTDEKSKIYHGEIEVGTENGVSVYPAFKTDEGDIVLGLSLPITKTTLYTQQHLIEYDDRPCYLVTGDYVGKDTDGQPLINNVSIIKKIDSYRIKEKKQVEPRFKVGDWVILTAGELSTTLQIVNIDTNKRLYWFNDSSYLPIVDEECLHLWTIKDVKDGDVLQLGGVTAIFQKYIGNGNCKCYCSIYDSEFEIPTQDGVDNSYGCCNAIPATKEQRDLLFQKMKEGGYEWDSEKKELKKVESKFKVGDWICNDMCIIHITSIENGMYYFDEGDGLSVVFVDEHYHIWTIQDAEVGDVLATDKSVFIYAKVLYGKPYAYCGVDKFGVFKDNCLEHDWTNSVDNIHPATKEQCDHLFQKMCEAGYQWNTEKKELKKIEPFDEYKGLTDFERAVADICIGWIGKEPGWKEYIKDNADILLKFAVKKFNSVQDVPFEQKPTWSEEDEEMLDSAVYACLYVFGKDSDTTDWLKSLKERIGE